MATTGLLEYIVNFENWDAESDYVSVYPATFKRDFGPWSKGDKVERLDLDVDRGVLSETDDEGWVKHSCAVKLAVVN